MRPLETLLLVVNLLVFVIWALPLPHAVRWLRHLTPGALLLAGAQVALEGSRWQMAPAYLLDGLCFLIWIRWAIAPAKAHAGPQPEPKRRARTVWIVALGLLGQTACSLLPLAFPVFSFPLPSGPYGIGTVTYHWVDARRPDIFSSDKSARRELMVQLWYPAELNLPGARAPYLADADAVMTVFAQLHRLPAFMFGHFKYVLTNAVASAPMARDPTRFPVLLFLEGASGFRQMNTFQVEALVSHGYIVAAIDQPGAAANVVFPDGHQTKGLTLAQFQDRVGPSYLPQPRAPGANASVVSDNGIIPYLAQDALFTLDQLAALNQTDPSGILNGRMDLEHAGTFGVSLGGIVVAEACRMEPRLRACLMLDAPMPADVVKAGLRQPSLWMTRDVASMELERQRAGGWSPTEIQAHQTSMRAVYQSLPGAGYFVRVPGMFHSNFMDVPNWSPIVDELGLTGPMPGQRAHDIVNAYSLAFFDRHLKERATPLLDRQAQPYPEVLFESRLP